MPIATQPDVRIDPNATGWTQVADAGPNVLVKLEGGSDVRIAINETKPLDNFNSGHVLSRDMGADRSFPIGSLTTEKVWARSVVPGKGAVLSVSKG